MMASPSGKGVYTQFRTDPILLHPHVYEITQTLQKSFGTPNLGNKQDPFEELLFIILSSKTPPGRYQRVFQQLKERYPDLESLANTQWHEVAAVITEAGLHNRKARAIVRIAQQTRDDFGKVTLDPLIDLSNEEAEKYLTSLPEVSTKTAKCVLMYSLNREVFPADNHCLCIARRLGWLSTAPTFSQKQAAHIEEGIPGHLRKSLHVGMIELGRNFCTPRNPSCETCPILRYCPTGKEAVGTSLP